MRKIVLASALAVVFCVVVADAAPTLNIFNASDRQFLVTTFRRNYDNMMRNFRNLRRQFVTNIRGTSFLPSWLRRGGNAGISTNGGNVSGLSPGGNTNLQETLDENLHNQGLQRHGDERHGDEEGAHHHHHPADGGHRRDRQMQGLFDNDLSREQQLAARQQRKKSQPKKDLSRQHFDEVEEPTLVHLVEPVGNELAQR